MKTKRNTDYKIYQEDGKPLAHDGTRWHPVPAATIDSARPFLKDVDDDTDFQTLRKPIYDATGLVFGVKELMAVHDYIINNEPTT